MAPSMWGIEGAPRRQGGSIERGSESAQIFPTTEPQPRMWVAEDAKSGKVERDTARVYMRQANAMQKIQIQIQIASNAIFIPLQFVVSPTIRSADRSVQARAYFEEGAYGQLRLSPPSNLSRRMSTKN